MKKLDSKKIDLILAILLIGSVVLVRLFDQNKEKIQYYLDKNKHPEKVTIEECYEENNFVYIKAHSNEKYKNSSKNKDDTDFYLLEYEPFEYGYEMKRNIDYVPKQKNFEYKIPLKYVDADPRRYYGDRKYNRFGVCVWDGDKYVLVSNLKYIEEKYNNKISTAIDDYIIEEKHIKDDNTVNILVLNPFNENHRNLIKEDATIKDYYEYYVPNVYEREGYEKVKLAFENIYKNVRRKYPYKNINWCLGVEVNKQTKNYLQKSDVENYSNNFYTALRVFYTFYTNAKENVKVNVSKENYNEENYKNSTDNICIVLDYDYKDVSMPDINYSANDFIKAFNNTVNELGKSKINILNIKDIDYEEYNVFEFAN